MALAVQASDFDFDCDSIWFEVCAVLFFGIGFAVFRGRCKRSAKVPRKGSQTAQHLAAGPPRAKKWEVVSKEFAENSHARMVKRLLKEKKFSGAFEYVKSMKQRDGCATSQLAVLAADFARAGAEAGRHAEVLDFLITHGIPLTQESQALLAEHCLKQQDTQAARRLEAAAREQGAALGTKACEALLRLYAATGDSRALELFREADGHGVVFNETLCVSLIARCAESKFLTLAEEIKDRARREIPASFSIYSVLMKTYANCGLHGRACDLYGAMAAEGLEPDQIMYSCFMKFAAECGRMDLLRELSSKVPVLDLQNSMSLILAANRKKDVRAAFRVLDDLKAAGVKPDITAYNAVLNVCAVAKNMSRADELLQEMRATGQVDLTTFNTALKGNCAVGDVRAATLLMSTMTAAGFPPNDISFNCIINMYVSLGKMWEAWAAVDTMRKRGFAADTYTVATMMKAAKKGSSSDLSRALALLDASGANLCGDEVLLNAVLEACSRHRDVARLGRVMDAFAASKLQPAAHTYASLIRACGILQKVDTCWELWARMECSMAPTDITLGCMMDSLVNNGHLEDAVGLLGKWKSRVGANVVMYSILLKGFAATHQTDRATELMSEMRKEGVALSTKVYNCLIDAHARTGSMDEAERFVKMMQEDGHWPDDFTRSLLVKGYCNAGNMTRAFEVFRGSAGEAPVRDVVVFNTILDGCVQHMHMHLADYLLDYMEQARVTPTNFTLAIAVKKWGRQQRLDKAFEAVAAWPKRYGFSVNMPVRTSLISACLANGATDRALEVFQELWAEGHTPDAKTYSTIISSCCRLGLVEDAIRLAEEAHGLDSAAANTGRRGAAAAAPRLSQTLLAQLRHAIAKRGYAKNVGPGLAEALRTSAGGEGEAGAARASRAPHVTRGRGAA